MKSSEDLGKLLLRVTVAGLLLFHGIDKILNGIDFIEAVVKAKDLPEFVAYGIYVGEVAAPILVILGFWTRLSALVIVINMGAAIWMVHMDHLGMLGGHGAWAVETPAFFLLGALCIVLLGCGRYGLDGRKPNID